MKNKRVKLPENVQQIISWTFDETGHIKCYKIKYITQRA